MQSISIISGAPLRIQKQTQFSQFRLTSNKVVPMEKNYTGCILTMSQKFKKGTKGRNSSPKDLRF